ncbi:unnamed protein product, partial [Brassica napus]
MDRSRSGDVGPSGKQQGMNHFISTAAKNIYAPPHHSYGTLTFPFNSHLSLRRSSKTETSPMR